MIVDFIIGSADERNRKDSEEGTVEVILLRCIDNESPLAKVDAAIPSLKSGRSTFQLTK